MLGVDFMDLSNEDLWKALKSGESRKDLIAKGASPRKLDELARRIKWFEEAMRPILNALENYILNISYRDFERLQGKKVKKSKIDNAPFCKKWIETRNIVLSRDNNECQICKTNKILDIHHIIPKSIGGNLFDKNNLITLCRNCHIKEHNKLRRNINGG